MRVPIWGFRGAGERCLDLLEQERIPVPFLIDAAPPPGRTHRGIPVIDQADLETATHSLEGVDAVVVAFHADRGLARRTLRESLGYGGRVIEYLDGLSWREMDAAASVSLPFHAAQESRRLAPTEIDVARQVSSQLRELVEARDAAASRLGPAGDVFLPAGNWRSDLPHYRAYHRIASGEPHWFDRLRPLSSMFTGRNQPALESGEPDPPPDRFALLYHSRMRHLPPELHLAAPPVFGEAGWILPAGIVNHDLYAILERIEILVECGLLERLRSRARANGVCRIVEIGAGYGGLASHLSALVPGAAYDIVDLPESLFFSGIYLSVLARGLVSIVGTAGSLLDPPTPGFRLLPNHMFDALVESSAGEIDLVINTLSLSEMSEAQILHYARGIARLIGEHGVFFEQNHDSRAIGLQRASDHIAPFFTEVRQLSPRSGAPAFTQGPSPNLWKSPARLAAPRGLVIA